MPFEMFKKHPNEASSACLLNLAETPEFLAFNFLMGTKNC